MPLPAPIVRSVVFPVHERLRDRPTLACLRDLERLCSLPPDAVQAECRARLRALFTFCAASLPYYRTQFRRLGIDPAGDDVDAVLAALPILEKSDVRARAEEMTFAAVPGGLRLCTSGGTTGEPLRFWIDRVRQAEPLAARLLMQGRFGVRPGQRRVYLWGSPIESKGGRVRRLRDGLLNERVLDAFHLAPADVDRYLGILRRFRPALIYAYPSAAEVLARRLLEHEAPAPIPGLRLVVLTGEEVSAEQRAVIGRALGCPVAVEYGSREIGLIAHECPAGSLHVISPCVHVEIAGNAAEGGEVLCTTLNTRAQPFVRYRLGDAGALVPGACACGLPLPRMRLLGGKVTGFIALRDGRLCHGAVTSHVLRDEPGIVSFKTHQRTLDEFDVWLVVNDAFPREAPARVAERYRALFGPQVRVQCRIVDRIAPDPSGKRRYVVSDVAAARAVDASLAFASASGPAGASIRGVRARCD